LGELGGFVGEGVAEGMPVSVVGFAVVEKCRFVVRGGGRWAVGGGAVLLFADVLGEALEGLLGVGAEGVGADVGDGQAPVELGDGVVPDGPEVGVNPPEGLGEAGAGGSGEVKFLSVGDDQKELGGQEGEEGLGGGVKLGAGDGLFPGDVRAEAGGIGGPAVGGLGGEEGPAADLTSGEVGVRFRARAVGLGEEVGVAVGEVFGGGALVFADFVVGDVGPVRW